jgi:hypothetical protein
MRKASVSTRGWEVFGILVRRDDDDARARHRPAQAHERVDAGAPGQAEVEEHQLELRQLARPRKRAGQVALAMDARGRNERAHHRREGLVDQRVIVDQQEIHANDDATLFRRC